MILRINSDCILKQRKRADGYETDTYFITNQT